MNSVVIVAAGTGSRMNMNINKQFIKLYDKEVIAYTIDAFYNNENIDEIVVVIREDEEEFFVEHIINKYMYKNIKIAYGGKERQDSVYNGLKRLDYNCNIVIVHDGARPFIPKTVLDESIREANLNNAVVVGVPVKDTIKVIDNNNIVRDTPNRKHLWAVQTPQVFNYKVLMDAYENAYNKDYYGTDDAMLVEYLGQEVKMIMGSYENIKITTKEDISFGEQILRRK
jgi:2-C-methyl-D-erythritol 4-phosphate cytidylyltransferase